MTPEHLPWICLAILLVSFLYSSVGQAGASGYIAVLALFSFAPAALKPTVLALTILVACQGTYQFWRAGFFAWPLFWPLALGSVPSAFLGGYLDLPPRIFNLVLGLLLLFSAAWFFVRPPPERGSHPPAWPVLLSTGGCLGFVSGLTGTGGGIFLTPLMIFLRWSPTKTAAAVASAFILVNALAGLAGNVSHTQRLPAVAIPLALAALIGGACGSYLGSRRFSPALIKRLLAVVLAIGGGKLLFS